MPNNLAANLTSLTADGVDLQRSDLSVHLDLVLGLNDGMRVRGADTVVPGARGRTPRSRVSDGRDLLLVGLLQGAGDDEATRMASYQSIRDELEELFSLEADPFEIEGVAPDGSTRSITARPVALTWEQAPVHGVGTLTVSLDAAAPDWAIAS